MSVDLSRLKAYAPQARKDFRKAVTERAARIGITAGGIVEAQSQGDVVIVGGAAYDKTFSKQRDVLVSKVKAEGFDQVIEEIAYTWFNRLVALRFMELHGYLEHGFQIVGPGRTEGVLPEALVNAELLNLPRLSPDRVREMKIAGDYEEQLYRAILIAQCNALSGTMGFMFEKIGDATELLLPHNLLATDGLIRKLVSHSDATSWKDAEVIGWLYQFYISEKKADVYKALKNNIKITADNIPAATQLFTPHWIVRYLVENSLGRLWLLNNPSSKLAEKMDYYIAPEEPESDFARITSPEEIRICDPACGSGHMLAYAFDLLYAIYEEAGYRARDIPSTILEKNLQGIEIDDRAGALAAFSLAMKARAKDGRFFTKSVEPQICVLRDIAFTKSELTDAAAMIGRDLFTDDLRKTLGQFEQAKNFGSLIIPTLRDAGKILQETEARNLNADMLLNEVQSRVSAVLRMAEALSSKYHVVIANPPYMTRSNMNKTLKSWIEINFPAGRHDLFAAFTERCISLASPKSFVGMVTIQNWMFLSSFEALRASILHKCYFCNLIQIGYNSFPELNSKVVQASAFVLGVDRNDRIGEFVNLNEAPQSADKHQVFRKKLTNRDFYSANSATFKRLPGEPIAYWVSDAIAALFKGQSSGEAIDLREGIHTGNNERFLRYWHEISVNKLVLGATCDQDVDDRGKWVPYNKGGPYRKWYGNNELVIAWDFNSRHSMEQFTGHVRPSKSLYFKEGGTWSALTSGYFGIRYYPNGHLFDSKGQVAVGCNHVRIIGQFNTKLFQSLAKTLMPTLDYKCGDVKKLPYLPEAESLVPSTKKIIALGRSDWDALETSWDFTSLALLSPDYRGETLMASYLRLRAYWQIMTDNMRRLEEENNRIFIKAYGLQDEMNPEVPIEEVTLTCNPAYRYGVKGTEKEREELLKRDTVRELISYSIGSMMGRYSLAEPGLIFADAGNLGFDASRYGHFSAQKDGIVPVTDVEWFPNDATARFIEFLRQIFGEDRLGENLEFVADSIELSRKISAVECIRRYFSRAFFKDHLRAYKNRPIYWLFSSGNERAFECLVYLHRYNEGTLGRMRAEYVIPLQTKMQNRIQTIEGEIGQGYFSSAQTKARTKELASLEAKKRELDRFEANLRHLAEERIALDLNDGVKANYTKFGDLLAETKIICGKDDE